MKLKTFCKILFLINIIGVFQIMPAQVIINHDITLDEDFEAQVKSIDEFMARFNGTESKPGIPLDSINRKNNILSLFDFSKLERDDTLDIQKNFLLGFCDDVEKRGNEITLKDSYSYEETICTFKYNKKNFKVTLLMRLESINEERSRWSIAGVKGLKKAGFYNDKIATISPVDHEIHFISLNDFFLSNKKISPALRSKGKEIDEFSMLIGMVTTGSVIFVSVDEVKFHFCDIPNYVFVVEEIGRRGNNSGWLITKLLKYSEKEKDIYLKDLFGKN